MSGYEEFWASDVLSDVDVLLFEDAEDLGTKRKQPATISSHKMVLAPNSEYFKAQLINWTPSTPSSKTCLSSKPQISMTVPAGQLELGQLLLKSMYQDRPDFRDLQQELWLPLLVLADKYGVPKVLAAVCSAFKSCEGSIRLETAIDYFRLPDSVVESQHCQMIADIAASRLQVDLGDLDMKAVSGDGQQLLLQLPFKALQSLLASSRTRVATENTVAYLVMQWIKNQPDSPAKQQQLQELLGLVRMAHCSSLFIATVISTDPDASSCLSPYELQVAGICSCGPFAAQYPSVANSVAQKFPLWCSSKRPDSMVTKPKYRWELPLDTVRQLYGQCQGTKSNSPIVTGPSHYWHGRSYTMGLQLIPGPQPASAQDPQNPTAAGIGMIVHLILKGSELSMAKIDYSLKMSATNGSNSTNIYLSQRDCIVTGHADGTLQHCMLRLSSSSWHDVEADLRAAHYVHTDDYLLIMLELYSLC